MTETTRKVFDTYQVRKTKKQKSAFIQYVKEQAEAGGYTCRVEKGMLGARNIVIGEPDAARVVYTAHYDTCPRLPFPNFITPKNIWIYLLYQVALVLLLMIPVFLVSVGIGFVVGWIGAVVDMDGDTVALLASVFAEVAWIGLLVLLLAGPANKNTANDNTSGVTTLLDIMNALPEEQRGKVAFVFFDLEESGLFGSAGFASKHKAAMKGKLLINFDCVSDGSHIIFAQKKGAKRYTALLAECFAGNEKFTVEVASKGIFYPSDQANFPCGVGVAALKSTKNGLLYMNRIHTKRDTVYCEENIGFLTEGAVRLAEKL